MSSPFRSHDFWEAISATSFLCTTLYSYLLHGSIIDKHPFLNLILHHVIVICSAEGRLNWPCSSSEQSQWDYVGSIIYFLATAMIRACPAASCTVKGMWRKWLQPATEFQWRDFSYKTLKSFSYPKPSHRYLKSNKWSLF